MNIHPLGFLKQEMIIGDFLLITVMNFGLGASGETPEKLHDIRRASHHTRHHVKYLSLSFLCLKIKATL